MLTNDKQIALVKAYSIQLKGSKNISTANLGNKISFISKFEVKTAPPYNRYL